MSMKKCIVIIFHLILFNNNLFAQNDTSTVIFFNEIKQYNLSTIFNSDSLLTEANETVKLKREEILGFIGNNYQRFYIHFTTVKKNSKIPYQYLVKGKTKINNIIHIFNGTITLTNARVYKNKEVANYTQGFTHSKIVITTFHNKAKTGEIIGNLETNFLIDKMSIIRYDALMFAADGFCNNQFIGTFKNIKTKNIEKCNWGEFRIPDCGDLDIGAGEFTINSKYIKHGWESYYLAWLTNSIEPAALKTKYKEAEKWW